MATADMGGGDPSRLRAALLGALRPLAAMLLRFGIGYREFAEVAKAAFVDAATAEFGVRGRPTNISRVAAMTGLTRKEVRRLRSRPDAAATTGPGTVPADVLHRWHTDPRYLDLPGIPRELPFDGPEPSFAGLVRACAGDLPAGAIRAELLRIGAVAEAPSGALRPSRREVVPASAMDAMLEGFATGMRPVTLTVAWNAAMAGSGGRRRFQRAVTSRQVPVDRVGEAEDVLRQRLTAWTEEVDDYLAGVERSPGPDEPAVPTVTLGIGMYYFEEPRPGGTDR
jgi:hypothetical protein